MRTSPEPSLEEIIKLRETTLEKLEKEGILDSLDPIDITRFKNEDAYVKRFLMHHKNNHDLALTMAIGTLKWRKESGANYITADSVDKNLLNKGVLFTHNRDIDGCKMLQFCVQKHDKSVESDKIRKLMIYWIERLEREEPGKWITMVFDMQDTGIRNMDMDFIQYTINMFKFYYPYVLNYILVIEMPWLLNAMWKIIKSWLPPEALEKIKFVDKKQLLTYVSIDQCTIKWGGTEEYKYAFTPEITTPQTSAVEEIDPKKVHFADSPFSSLSTTKTNGIIGHTESGNLSVEVLPTEELVFSTNRVGSITTITVRNCGTSIIAFKIKTTAPDKYRVKPSVGTLTPKEKADIIVTLCEALNPSVLVRDKFLVLVVAAGEDGAVTDGSVFKNVAREDLYETKLRLGIQNPDSGSATAVTNHDTLPTMVVPVALTDKLNEIVSKQTDLQREVNSSFRLMILTLLTMLAILVYVIISTNATTSLLLHKSSISMQKSDEL